MAVLFRGTDFQQIVGFVKFENDVEVLHRLADVLIEFFVFAGVRFGIAGKDFHEGGVVRDEVQPYRFLGTVFEFLKMALAVVFAEQLVHVSGLGESTAGKDDAKHHHSKHFQCVSHLVIIYDSEH